jgi:hypothetical protein
VNNPTNPERIDLRDGYYLIRVSKYSFGLMLNGQQHGTVKEQYAQAFAAAMQPAQPSADAVECAREKMSDVILDAPMELTVVRWEGKPAHCIYLNNHRICGEKPWGGGTTTRTFEGVTVRELARAIPSLREYLGLDSLGRSKAKALASQGCNGGR